MTDLAALQTALEIRQKIQDILEFDRLQGYAPYPWQEQAHEAKDDAGRLCHQIMIMGGNRIGKTQFGAADLAIHLTGRYPKWWKGRRYTKPIRAIVGGVSTVSTRDILQKALLGGDPENPEVFGSGWIPRECLVDAKGKPMTERWVGLPGGVQKFYVRHVSGKLSQCDLKSYEQGPGPWMGIPAEEVRLDEEPPQAIYSQALRATVDTGGTVTLTMTPENGATDVVRQFMTDLRPGQLFMRITWDDSPHLTPEIREQLLLAFPIHEREMRSKGIPMLGSGKVFPFSWESVSVEAFPIPASWPRIAGLDLGSGDSNHPTACGWIAFDPNTGNAYGYDAYKGVSTSAAVHAVAIKGRGAAIPVAWPHDGNRKDGYNGDSMAVIYRSLGVNLLRDHFRNPDSKDNAVEPGITAMSLAMEGGRFKWFRHLNDVREEFEIYHRKDGEIVKKADDLMSTYRYAFQSRRFAKAATPPEYDDSPVEGTLNYNPFAHTLEMR